MFFLTGCLKYIVRLDETLFLFPLSVFCPLNYDRNYCRHCADICLIVVCGYKSSRL